MLSCDRLLRVTLKRGEQSVNNPIICKPVVRVVT
jgi:hypothetical protein